MKTQSDKYRVHAPRVSASLMNASLLCVSLLCASLICPSLLQAEETTPFRGWKQASTNHFRFIYEDASKAQAAAFAAAADPAWNKLSEIYSTPPEMTDVLVTGRTDMVNAYAEGLSMYMGFFTTPPLSPDIGYREDWSTLFFTHELTHIANFSFEGKKHTVSDIFGPFWNIVNFSAIPGWALEGLTTYLETALTDGGRGRSPFFELYYKAPALENSFLHFDEIGLEQMPPRGQIYVMGYLMIQSISDRWGKTAVADIERNRTAGRDYGEAVRLVTGMTVEEIFQDVRVSLAKKYAEERKIPEGKTITPRALNSDYYRPAFIASDGIFTLRDIKGKDRAAVRLDPATGEEKILFEGVFADELSLTVSENGRVIASLVSARRDLMPGSSAETDLYSWSEKSGLVQLTRGSSLFQPALSRSGNTLVAVELSDTRYRLVKVDIRTGERRILLESHEQSYIQPALSPDGKEISFLILNGKRAILASAPMPAYEFAYPVPDSAVKALVNADGPLIDIAYPVWTAEGSILFSSNERGRLEVWEYRDGKKAPVVSDPVGAFWAEKTAQGICYASYSGNGYVLKMKPDSEWGAIPDYPGPSSPGAVYNIGGLASDYPLFTPYPSGEKDEKKKKDKILLPRTEGIRMDTTQPILLDEKNFYNIPRPSLWMPSIGYLALRDNEHAFGAGAFAIFEGYPLQNGSQGNMLALGGKWYPEINQADAFVFASFPVQTGTLMLYGERQLSLDSRAEIFRESSSGLASFSCPFYRRSFYRDLTDFSLVTGVRANAERSALTVFKASDAIPWKTGITGSAGLDLYRSKMRGTNAALKFKLTPTLLVSRFPSISTSLFLSAEVNAAAAAGTKDLQGELSIRSRWFDLPPAAPLPITLVNPKGESLDCLYPGRTIVQAALVLPKGINSRFYMEKLISSGTAAAGAATPRNGTMFNILIDKNWYAGFEFEAEAGRSRIAFGAVNHFQGVESIDLVRNSRIYLTVKLDALQGSIP